MAQVHLSGLTHALYGWAVPLDAEVCLYGPEAAAYGLLVVAATPLLVYFALPADNRLATPGMRHPRWAPVDRGLLWGDNPAGRGTVYAKLARALAHV